MSDMWQGTGIWAGWRLTTDHSASSYNQLVLVSPDGRAFGPGDITGTYSQADLAKALGVSRSAIAQRIQRETLPPFDGQGKNGRDYWHFETIRHLLLDDKQ
ncbi:AsnC family protein [Brevibacillus sp. AG]|uniref:AsnC family protein n=1 Tax=Brevibacillus sp. AG TaxID=3020891 RepID=UPI0023306E43|nr:AsnC family protein [Brevibacillus sp. AG]MDC0764879.1 AsnC family protein [Brevibacillus sp. AG]